MQLPADKRMALCYGRRRVFPVHAELDKDCGVFNHGSEAPNEPGEVCEEVLFFDGVEEDSCAVSSVTEQGEHEEEKGKANRSDRQNPS